MIDLAGKAMNWDDVLKTHNGKILYVDFWASWCVPCRKMMPYSRALKKDLVNYPVSFIYVSSDNAKNLWRNAVSKEGLQNEEHYSVARKDSSLFSLYQIKSIPRYMIYDKNGEIIDARATAPNDNKTKQLLIKYSLNQ